MHIVKRDRSRTNWGDTEMEVMRRMHAEGAFSEEIALATGFSDQTVRRKMWDNGLTPNARMLGIKAPHQPEQKPPRERINPLTLAETTLGTAFDRERMRLNGTPIRFLDLMREVNKVLHARGEQQWTGDDACLIR